MERNTLGIRGLERIWSDEDSLDFLPSRKEAFDMADAVAVVGTSLTSFYLGVASAISFFEGSSNDSTVYGGAALFFGSLSFLACGAYRRAQRS